MTGDTHPFSNTKVTSMTDCSRRNAITFVISFMIVSHSCAIAQTLTEKLKAEPASALAADARTKGDAVQGALLFTNQKLACTSCHGSIQQNLLGPDLTRLNSNNELPDAHLVESILNPSQVISKGFETSSIVMKDGRTLNGRVTFRNDNTIVIREASTKGQLQTLNAADIEEVLPQKISGMPDKLADQLSSRQEFLNLVRYLMEISATDTNSMRTAATTGGGTIDETLQGLILLNEFQCTACHADRSQPSLLTAHSPPNLKWFSGRINPSYIKQFIASPLNVKPGTTMPDMMTQLSESDRNAAAEQITHYLLSTADQTGDSAPAADASNTDSNTETSSERGKELFHSIGCVACHSPRSTAGDELLADTSVSLLHVVQKFTHASLVEFLKNPHIVRPAGRMPNLNLTHWEALDVAAYLLEKQNVASTNNNFQHDEALAQQGKQQFEKLGCMTCHTRSQLTDAPGISIANATPLAKLRADQGCLSNQTGRWPQFSMTGPQRNAIQAALSADASALTSKQQIDVTLTAFRCLNCHDRNELGGISPERSPHFQTTNPNIGPQGSIPPTLTNVGAKLNPDWLRQVLVSGRAIRPYVKTRMPQFGKDNIVHLVELFAQTDQLPDIEFGKLTDKKEARTTGHELAGTAGLNCIVCHTFRREQAANMSAVDLTEMTERLQQKWFYHYMKAPQRMSPNTIMPSFWPGGKAIRQDILNGDSNLQMEALWQYLSEGRHARAPRGLIQEPMHLLATNEAVMLRRSYPGVGKRGIGVGYPNQVNLVYDAEQMRLATLWKGQFADTGGVWRSQGHGTVHPLSRNPIQFATGPDIDNADTPWVVDDGRPPQHQFKGYSLDDLRRPRFRYRFQNIDITDSCVDLKSESSNQPFIRRTLTLQCPTATTNIRFRVADGTNITRQANGTFIVNKQLKIQVPENQTAKIVETPFGQQLHLYLTLPAGTSTFVFDYMWQD